MTKEEELEYRLLLARFAAMGIVLIGAYGIAPFLMGDMAIPVWEHEAQVADNIVSRLPFLPVASAVAIGAFIRSVTKRMPRRVDIASAPEFVDLANRQDMER